MSREEENEGLRSRLFALELENRNLAERTNSVELVLQENERLRELVNVLVAEKAYAHEQSLARRAELLAAAEEEKRRLRQELAESEAEHSNLAHLYVAARLLHGMQRRRDVLEAVHDIVTNLIGSQEAALFERSEDGGMLVLAGCFGVDPSVYRRIRLGQGRIGDCAQTGESFFADANTSSREMESERDLSACIPLKLEGRVVGALALFQLLPQKSAGLVPLDHELLELLATHAAGALDRTGERQRDPAEVRR